MQADSVHVAPMVTGIKASLSAYAVVTIAHHNNMLKMNVTDNI